MDFEGGTWKVKADNRASKSVNLQLNRQTSRGSVPTGMDAVGASGRWLRSDKPLLKDVRCGASAAPDEDALVKRYAQRAASLSFFSARIFSFTVAGLAANHCSSLVNGLMPLRLGLAGTLTAVIFSRPGMVK